MTRSALFALALICACGESTSPREIPAPPALASLTVTLSNSTIGRGQTSIATASGKDQVGVPIATGAITWSSSAPTIAAVNAGGIVTAVSGGTAAIIASAGGKSASAEIKVLPIATRLVFTTPPPSEVTNRKAFAPVLQLVDANGAPVAERGVNVFVSHAGGGSLIGNNVAESDESGAVRFDNVYFSGPAGPRILSFTTNGLQALQTNLSLLPGDAAQIVANAGNHQFARTGTAVSVAPSVRVTDTDGNPVGGIPITFLVTQGGGSITGASTTSNAAGVATVGSWTLGAVGTNALFVRIPDRQIFGSLDATATPASVQSVQSLSIVWR